MEDNGKLTVRTAVTSRSDREYAVISKEDIHDIEMDAVGADQEDEKIYE